MKNFIKLGIIIALISKGDSLHSLPFIEATQPQHETLKYYSKEALLFKYI